MELPNRVSEFRILGIMHQVLDFYWEKGAGQGAIYLKPHAHAYLKKRRFWHDLIDLIITFCPLGTAGDFSVFCLILSIAAVFDSFQVIPIFNLAESPLLHMFFGLTPLTMFVIHTFT